MKIRALDKSMMSTLLVLVAALFILFDSSFLMIQQNNVVQNAAVQDAEQQNGLLPVSNLHGDLNREGLLTGTADVTFQFNGQDLNLDEPVIYQENRYFLPFNEIVLKMGGSIEQIGQLLSVHWLSESVVINQSDRSYFKDNTQFSYTAIPEGDNFRISLSDLCKMFNLVTDWKVENHVIGLYVNREPLRRIPLTHHILGKPALIRLEDISIGGPYYSAAALAKLRAVADYLYEENVPFHVAWVPRYIDPSNLIDRSLADQYSVLNADFLFTLDYLISRNGIIGLHGYTHQFGNTVTLKGTEFRSIYEDNGIPDSARYVKSRLNLAIEAAQKLNIPYGFFEAPHYVMSPKALRIAERYFNFIYQSSSQNPNQVVQMKTFAKKSFYVPTPLGYIHGEDDLERVFKIIRQKNSKVLASFYFHPFLEFKNISIEKDVDGYPEINYSQDSILHQLVQEFKNQGYTFMSLDQLAEDYSREK